MILLKVGYSGYAEFKYDCVKYVNSLNNDKDTVNKENNKIEKIYWYNRIDALYLNDKMMRKLAVLVK